VATVEHLEPLPIFPIHRLHLKLTAVIGLMAWWDAFMWFWCRP